MSELIDTGRSRTVRHWRLLTTVSMLALISSGFGPSAAKAEGDDTQRSTVWIEVGGQLERQSGNDDIYTPPFVFGFPAATAYTPFSPIQSEKPLPFSFGGEGKLSFAPENSNWIFSAGVRYGRANGSRQTYQKSAGFVVHSAYPVSGVCCVTHDFVPDPRGYSGGQTTRRDSHMILDFKVGRDVGLGLFGRGGEALVSVGVRYAQLTTRSDVSIHARPDLAYYNGVGPYRQHLYPGIYVPFAHFHAFSATAHSARSFHGFGPSITWDASVLLVGNPEAGEISFDWGSNAALLFGHRKADGQHHEASQYRTGFGSVIPGYARTTPFDRKRSVTMPNVGGFAGVSFELPHSKVSFGYRGDFFFGAMDVGNDTRKTETVGFYGPFATVSVGIGG